MNPAAQPLLVVFAGPNGAGKSTLRRVTLGILPLPFVNADDIARERFGENAATRAYDAAALAEEERQRLFAMRCDFSFETVLSDLEGEKIHFLLKARGDGYYVIVHFVGLDSPERSRARVFQRVLEGGHDVPDEKIAARYARVMTNLARLLAVPDELTIYDNSSSSAPYRVVAVLTRGVLREVTRTIPSWAQPLNLPALIRPETVFIP